MQSIFKDERRGLASFNPNPCGTGLISPAAASQAPCVASTTRRHLLLTAGETRSRHGDILIVRRP